MDKRLLLLFVAFTLLATCDSWGRRSKARRYSINILLFFLPIN